MVGSDFPGNTGKERAVRDAVEYFLAPRRRNSHKGDFGRIFIIAGSRGMSGAAILCARACLHAGGGLVYAVIPGSLETVISTAVPEAVKLPVGGPDSERFKAGDASEVIGLCRNADAVVLGPGLGRDPQTVEFVRALMLSEGFAPDAAGITVDADGLYALSGNISLLREAAEKHPGKIVLTPHEAEAARLTETVPEEVSRDRERTADILAENISGGVALLKGNETIIRSYPDLHAVNHTGNPGMATGGSGDVLSGMIGAFIGQEAAGGYDPDDEKSAGSEGPEGALRSGAERKDLFEIVACGATIHGLCGDIMAARYGERYITASDLIDGLGEIKGHAEQYASLG